MTVWGVQATLISEQRVLEKNSNRTSLCSLGEDGGEDTSQDLLLPLSKPRP